MSALAEAKAKYKEVVGRAPHHTWGLDKILEKLNGKSDTDEEAKDEEVKEEKPKEKRLLKPKHSRLFVPKVEGKPARTVLRDNWNEGDEKQYREAYKDRLQKAMKKLN